MRIQPVILSGGTGSRLWPLSRELMPKQFLPLANSGRTLLQDTLLRLEGIASTDPVVICNSKHHCLVVEQIQALGINRAKIILEPMGKNTAPAVAIAALNALQHQDEILLVLPADHKIINTEAFRAGIIQASVYAQEYLVTFGITAYKPETGYGYIEIGQPLLKDKVYHVAKFVEKPTLEQAQKYLQSGKYFWNSGMFMFQASRYLAELKKYAPEMLKAVEAAFHNAQHDADLITIDLELFSNCPADSIDYAVMEKTDKAIVVPIDCHWSDVGSWAALWETQEQDTAGNATQGDVVVADTTNSYLHAENRMVVAVGLQDSVVIETKDAVLVANRNNAQQVKKIVEQLKAKTRTEVINHQKIYQIWGSEEILIETPNYSVRHILIKPHASLLLRLEHQNFSHLVVVKGNTEIIVDEQILKLQQSDSMPIVPIKQHRVYNREDIMLELIEVQTSL